jgi:hypothetical protein
MRPAPGRGPRPEQVEESRPTTQKSAMKEYRTLLWVTVTKRVVVVHTTLCPNHPSGLCHVLGKRIVVLPSDN